MSTFVMITSKGIVLIRSQLQIRTAECQDKKEEEWKPTIAGPNTAQFKQTIENSSFAVI